MKTTSCFINTAGGKVTDEAALIKALREKWTAGAGLDVFETEPLGTDNPLPGMKIVIVIPRTAAHSDAALELQPIGAVKEVMRVLSGQRPKNVINQAVKPGIDLVEEDSGVR